MRSILFAMLSISMSVGAQFMLRSAVGGRQLNEPSWGLVRELAGDWRLVAGLLLYVMSAIVWLKILSQWEVSKAYPLVGVGFALTVIVGWMLGEQVGAQRIGGVALISLGVILVARS